MISTTDTRYDDQRSALVISDTAAATYAARSAAAHADLRLLGAVGFADARDWFARAGEIDLIVAETAGVAADVLEPALTVIDVVARERDIDVVVAMAPEQVDLVSAQLFGRHAQLLCDPDVTERVAALRWAGALRGHGVHDSGRDADERLRRLNAEVARFAETLAQLATDRSQPRAATIRDVSTGFRGEPVGARPTAPDPTAVRDVIRARRMRAPYFAEDLFADPAWDMLLDLFAAELEHRRVSVSSLCIAGAVPGTTALRWIGSMVEARLFERYDDPQDRRRAFISLSAKARDGMAGYFDAVRRAGLTPA